MYGWVMFFDSFKGMQNLIARSKDSSEPSGKHKYVLFAPIQ